MYNIYHQDNTTFFSDALRRIRIPEKSEKTSAMVVFLFGKLSRESSANVRRHSLQDKISSRTDAIPNLKKNP
jgi:hypothetical protein